MVSKRKEDKTGLVTISGLAKMFGTTDMAKLARLRDAFSDAKARLQVFHRNRHQKVRGYVRRRYGSEQPQRPEAAW